MWGVLPVAAAILFFALPDLRAIRQRLEEERRRREVIDLLEQGMSVVDRQGRVTLWNDALERMLDCSARPRARRVARSRRAGLGLDTSAAGD